MKRNATEPQFSSAKDDVTPFKVNGDPSPLTDQRIPTQRCECSVSVSGMLSSACSVFIEAIEARSYTALLAAVLLCLVIVPGAAFRI